MIAVAAGARHAPRTQSVKIKLIERVRGYVGVQMIETHHCAVRREETEWIRFEIPSDSRVVIPHHVVRESRLPVEILPRESQVEVERSGSGRLFTLRATRSATNPAKTVINTNSAEDNNSKPCAAISVWAYTISAA